MNILEGIMSSWVLTVLEWYAQTFMVLVSPELLLIQLELLVVIYLVLQVLGLLFPMVNRLMAAAFLPFRLLHVWLHLRAAQKLDLLTPDSDEQLVINRFLTGTTGDDRAALGIKAPKSTRDAYRIATAPTKGAVIVILLSFIVSPILLLFGPIGFFIHLYVLLGSLTTLWADARDYLFAYQVALLNADLSPRYLGWTVPVFGVAVIGTLVSTGDILRALLTGIGFTAFYLLGLLWVVSRIGKKDKESIPQEEPPTLEIGALLPFPEITLPSCER
ncbi:MAG: hypothetical protein ACFFBD_12605 [Candidatus Hodarchaeota archaeon]